MLKLPGHYVEATCKDDEAAFTSSGFALRFNSTRPQLVSGLTPGTIDAFQVRVHGDCRAGAVLNQTFQSRAVSCMNRRICMQTEAVHTGAAEAYESLH